MPPDRSSRRPAIAAAIVVAAALVWTLWTARADGSRPLPTLAAYVGVAGAFVLGGHLARLGAEREPRRWVVVAIAAPVVLLVPFAAGARPLGYGNANGAVYAVLTLGAARLLAMPRWSQTPSARRDARIAVGVLALATMLTGSVGATACLAAGAALLAATWGTGRAAAAVAGAAVLIALAVVAVVAVADGAGPARPGDDSLGTRIALWREAEALLRDHPVAGVGPGRFQDESTVSTDADLRRAHSAPLQAGAEQGYVGLALLLAFVACALAVLWSARAADPRAVVVAAAVLMVVGVHATFDWVASNPFVTLPAAVVVGSAVARRRSPRSVERGSLGSRRPRR